jgi:chromosome segregation protein
LARLGRQIQDIEQRMDVAKTVGNEIRHEFETLAEREAAEGQRCQDGGARALECASALADARGAADVAADARVGGREAVQSGRQKLKAVRDSVSEARLGLERYLVQVEGLEQRVAERFQLSLEELAAYCEQAPPLQEEDRARLSQLESLIDRIGEVHLGAVQECKEAEERYTFLTGQRDDLLAGLDDLVGAIAEMNRESERLFSETFETVNGHFQRIFPRLFRGGTAELRLTDPENLLETGIDMHVSPPGKKVQNVGLLSGGEKAMCALALVFAVFHFKPSPFCLLDEVDAPLDDANIGRFNEVIREIARGSQVVLVTHNKRTMEIADALYGVTMEEAGVSKLVGVKMT